MLFSNYQVTIIDKTLLIYLKFDHPPCRPHKLGNWCRVFFESHSPKITRLQRLSFFLNNFAKIDYIVHY